MFFVLKRMYKNSLYLMYSRAWTIIFVLLALIYVSGYYLMLWAGETALTDSYFWFFLVTVSTVGYGDLYPGTFEGRIVAVVIIIFGIGTLSIIIAKIIEFFIHLVDRFSRGLGKVKFNDQTLLMGYRPGITEKVIEEIRLNNPEEHIVLCSEIPETNPCADNRISYIRGELASDDVHNRSNLKDAAKIIVHGDDDNETFFTAYSARQINKTAHLVCYLQNAEHKDKINNLPSEAGALNQVILPVNSYLMAQELQDPESSGVFQHLISNVNGATLFRINIPSETPEQWSFETLFMNFRKQHNATIIAIKNDTLISNPDMDEPVKANTALFYIAKKRIETIQWAQI